MRLHRRTSAIIAGAFALSFAVLGAAGCKKSEEATPAAPSPGNTPTTLATASAAGSGKAVFDSNGCGRCHSIGGGGGRQGAGLSPQGRETPHTPPRRIAPQKKP